jgi:CheY-like chemotaxis protein
VSFSTDKFQGIEEISSHADVAVIELDLGGFGVTKEVRERTPDRHVRLVLVCSRAHDRWLCKQAGADDVVVKPLSDVSQLSRAIIG